MSHIHAVSEQIAIQRPRTRVGKISAQSMLGIGPNAMKKQQKYTRTLAVGMTAFITLPKFTKLPITSITRAKIKMGIVPSNRLLQWDYSKDKKCSQQRDNQLNKNIIYTS